MFSPVGGCLGLVWAMMFGVAGLGHADPGDVDTSFSIGTGANGVIFATKVRTNDNKIYIGGVFDNFNGNSAKRIARLNVTGAFDTTFVTPGTESSVNAIGLQEDLKCVIGGDFTFVGNTSSRRLARLNDNGSLDTTFTQNLGTGPDGGVDAITVQPDGKILVGGRFLNFNGVARRRLLRLNADGSLDTTFSAGLGPNQPVVSIQVQPDGKSLICGNFTSFNGVVRAGIVRLNADGSVDSTFDPGAGASGLVNGAIVQADGKIIVYGGFNFFDNEPRVKIVRLEANGTIDAAYAQNTVINSDIRDAELLPSGKLTIVGVFFEINGLSRRSVARLAVDGSHDTAFNPGTAAGYLDSPGSAPVNASGLDTEGRLVIVGEFRQFNEIPFNFITRVGTADPTPPLLITHPTNLFILTGSNASFAVTASGTEPLRYQWRFNGVNIPGATNNPITIPNAQAINEGLYSVVVANSAGTATSSNASLTLGLFPFFVTPPQSVTNFIGANESFSVTAGGTAPLFYQWFFGGAALPGQTNPTLARNNLQLADAGLYTIVVSNLFGAVTNSATVTVASPPAFAAGPGGGGPDGQPQSLTVVQGQNATFSANAIGSAPLTYQWRFAGVNIPGATNSSVTIANAQTAQAGLYSVVVSNPFGSTTSANATLTVIVPPAIVPGGGLGGPDGQPQSLTVLQGQTATFSANAVGTAPLTYQWRFGGVNIPGANAATLTLNNVVPSQAGLYSVVISNTGGTATSANATLTVLTPPTIAPGPNGGGPDGHPQSLTVVQGQNATFSVNATGTAPLTYQWRFGGVNIAGATNTSVTLTNVLASQAGLYSVVISNSGGSTTSSNATLTVLLPPTIIVPPVSQTLTQGATLNLSVTATGSPTLTYQWRFNGATFPGATAPFLSLFNVQESAQGDYTVVVSNPYGSVTSVVAVVTVQSPSNIFDAGQPQPQTVIQGSNATFSVTAVGDAPFTYQWRFGGVNIPGATSNPLVLTGVQTNQAGNYSVVVSNPFGSATSANALLTVRVPPFIVTQPTPATQTVVAGSNASITVAAGGDPTLTYQWRLNGVNVPGATAATLALTGVQTNQLGLYTVVVSNPYGSVTSSNATLDVKAAPFVASQPQSLAVLVGSPAAFSVTPGGDGPFSYQWRFGGVNLTGATNASFGHASALTNDAGLYSVLISSPYGTVVSSNATLTVNVPPTIVTHPQSLAAVAGSNATFTVAAIGDPTLTYQWRFNGAPITGANTATLTLTNVQAGQVGLYSVVVSNPFGTATSSNATLTVHLPPGIAAGASQPQPQTVIQGNNASFSVTATGDAPLTYQWQFNGVPIPGAISNPLVLTGVQTNQAGNYSVVVSNPYGSTTSSNALLTVRVPPFIVTQPASQTVNAGLTVSFVVVAGGDPTLTYQWRLNGNPIAGATSPTLTLANVQASQAGLYSVVVSNPYGTAVSANATLTVTTAPFVASHPQSLTVLKGTNAAFSVTAGGDGPFTYQWRFGGGTLAGATNNPLTLTNVQTNQAGLYSVVITSPYGTVTTSNATLTVLDPPVIVVQPVSAAVLAGDNVTFFVGAIGRPTLNYQWCKNDVVIPGATNLTLTLNNVTTAYVANYSVKVSNSDGNVTSVTATLSFTQRTLQVVSTQVTSATTNFTAGTAVSVPVALTAEGGENRVTASVAYDIAKLTLVSVTAGPGGATLVSTNAAAQGLVGFDLALASGQSFTPGTNVVVFLNFTVTAGVTQSIASLMLQGTPVANQVLSTTGAPLPAYYRSGAVILKSLADYTLRAQTGATEEELPIFNPAGSVTALTFLRISFFDLGNDSLGNPIRLINATGTNNGVPFVLIPTAIVPAGSFPLNVEYYVSDRVTKPNPRLVVEVVTGGFPPTPAGTVLSLDRVQFHEGRFKVDFASQVGKTYYIQYSSSVAGPYETSFPGIAGTGGHIQWVDTGPPRTTSLPTTAGSRFYRLLQVP